MAESERRNGKKWRNLGIGLGIVAVAAAAGLIWFFGGDPPDAVDLDATASEIASDATTGSSTAATSSSTTAPDDQGIEGTWTVDTTIGDFDLEDTTTASFVGFRVQEVLRNIGKATAVGRTPGVSGSAVIAGTILSSIEVTADMTAIVSNESRRDGPIQRALKTSTNPDAGFVLTAPIELGASAAEGEAVSATATGDLTINGITQSVSFEVEAQLIDGRILVTATTEVVFADFDITAPGSPSVLSVEDHGIVEVQLWLTKG